MLYKYNNGGEKLKEDMSPLLSNYGLGGARRFAD